MKNSLVFLFLFSCFLLFGCTQQESTVDLSKLSTPPAGSIGSDSAPVTIVEYSDYQCPLCRVWFIKSKKQLMDEYVLPGKVKFVFKDYVLSMHPMAGYYAVAARCAKEEGKYFEMHDKIYLEQDLAAGGGVVTVNNLSISDISNWAKDLGLDLDKFNSCLTSDKFNWEMANNQSEAVGIGINGTPSFVIGKSNGKGVVVIGAVPYSTLKAKIDEALK